MCDRVIINGTNPANCIELESIRQFQDYFNVDASDYGAPKGKDEFLDTCLCDIDLKKFFWDKYIKFERPDGCDYYIMMPMNTNIPLFDQMAAGALVPANLSNPQFETVGQTLHDWRRYVPDIWRQIWSELTEREKQIIFVMAETQADLEEYE